METKPRRNVRQGLSLAERIQVIEARQKGKSMRQLAAQFGCGKTQILNTLAQKDRYIHEWELLGGRNNPVIGARKRFRHTRNEEINRSVYEWYQQQTNNGQSVTGPMLQRQARLFAAALGIVTFAASNGWLANFRRFYNILSSNPRKNYQKLVNQETSISDSLTSQPPVPQPDAEFVPVAYETEDRVNVSHDPSPGVTSERDPLEENSHSAEPVDEKGIKLEPPDQKEDGGSCPIIERNAVNDSILYCAPNEQTILPGSNTVSCIRKHESQPRSCVPLSQNMTSTTINHRKRRLLQDTHSTFSVNPGSISTTQVSERKGSFMEVVNFARSKGLLTLLFKDDFGSDWLEIRQSTATYRVPKYDYPTHLSRLIVDSSLHYFLEVLGHCVRKGSLYQNLSDSLNYSEITSIFCALDGGCTVCQGRESVLKIVPDLDLRTAQEIGLNENMYFTLPDFRYRSHDCFYWIDRRAGSSCLACITNPSHQEDNSSTAIDLRCIPHHQ